MQFIKARGITPFVVNVASTPAQLTQGLSGILTMPKKQGLLFIFSSLKPQSMWMPDMNFPLDIVWIDATKTIVKIEVNATPCSGNHNCTSYSSVFPVLYAIELNAFDAASIGLERGMQLEF